MNKGAQFACINIKNFYLDTPMKDPKYVQIIISDIPKKIILENGLSGKEDHTGWIYFEICNGCYGLPQTGILASNLLHGRLEKESYYEADTTLGLWCTNGNQCNFSLLLTILVWSEGD
jgi:hypothetical protein